MNIEEIDIFEYRGSIIKNINEDYLNRSIVKNEADLLLKSFNELPDKIRIECFRDIIKNIESLKKKEANSEYTYSFRNKRKSNKNEQIKQQKFDNTKKLRVSTENYNENEKNNQKHEEKQKENKNVNEEEEEIENENENENEIENENENENENEKTDMDIDIEIGENNNIQNEKEKEKERDLGVFSPSLKMFMKCGKPTEEGLLCQNPENNCNIHDNFKKSNTIIKSITEKVNNSLIQFLFGNKEENPTISHEGSPLFECENSNNNTSTKNK
ncbi:hypothetical protein ACTFIU_000948 [Dictyostelium citrinum]